LFLVLNLPPIVDREEPVLTQVESVTSKKYHHKGFQSTIGMAIPVGELQKWVSKDMDIGDKESETAHTMFMEAISLDTGIIISYVCLPI
jgi:hypothetical protein